MQPYAAYSSCLDMPRVSECSSEALTKALDQPWVGCVHGQFPETSLALMHLRHLGYPKMESCLTQVIRRQDLYTRIVRKNTTTTDYCHRFDKFWIETFRGLISVLFAGFKHHQPLAAVTL